MADFGITDEGFVRKSVSDILSEMIAEHRVYSGVALNAEADSVIGNLFGVSATQSGQVHELLEKAYENISRDNATGLTLSYHSANVGVIRNDATYSRVTATVNVDPGTYAIGTLIASVDGYPEYRFENEEEVANADSAAADVDVVFVAQETGPIRANAGTLTVIAQPVTGWNEITNAEDATEGQDEQSDASLDEDTELALSLPGSSTADAIRADILENISGVLSCSVIENKTSDTDSNGLEPHSIEAIVLGPDPATSDDDKTLAEQILQSLPAGIGTNGTTEVVVEDSQGNEHTVKFSRPTDVDVYFDLDITIISSKYAGDNAVKQAIVDWCDENLDPGDDVYELRIRYLALSVAGVEDASELRLGTSASPTGTSNISIGIREIARVDTSRITINTTEAS